jgi:hypothetical protein
MLKCCPRHSVRPKLLVSAFLPHATTQRCQMLYASPRTILEYLACHGPSATQAEALVLLGRPVPDSWPKCRLDLALNEHPCLRVTNDKMREQSSQVTAVQSYFCRLANEADCKNPRSRLASLENNESFYGSRCI